ncbi:MAG: hypothetical protein QM266_01895 [Bacillota bacterium]|nr:hypothetical protein [Bacillota bacterium]NLP22058.1 hypothetical protein [Erysipelotrichaceae bacterium]
MSKNKNKNILVYMLDDKSKNKYSDKWFEKVFELYNVTDLLGFKQRVYETIDGEDIIFREKCKYLYKETETRYKKVDNTSFAFSKDGIVPVFGSQKVPYQEDVTRSDIGEIVKTSKTHYFYGKKYNLDLRPNIVVSTVFTGMGLLIYTNNGKYEFNLTVRNLKKAVMLDELYFYLKEKIKSIPKEEIMDDSIFTPGTYIANRDIETGIYDITCISDKGRIKVEYLDESFDINESWKNLEVKNDTKLTVFSGEYKIVKKG